MRLVLICTIRLARTILKCMHRHVNLHDKSSAYYSIIFEMRLVSICMINLVPIVTAWYGSLPEMSVVISKLSSLLKAVIMRIPSWSNGGGGGIGVELVWKPEIGAFPLTTRDPTSSDCTCERPA